MVCKHDWCHEGLEWFEGIKQDGTIFGKHFCKKCGEVNNFIELKHASLPSQAHACQVNMIKNNRDAILGQGDGGSK